MPVALVLSGCSSPSYVRQESTTSCSDVLKMVIEGERSGQNSDAVNRGFEVLSSSCKREFNIAVDYISSRVTLNTLGNEECERFLAGRISSEALELLREDGLCLAVGQGVAPSAPSAPEWPNGGLGWDSAMNHVGSYQRVCGPVRSVRNTEHGVFVNVGEDYPSQRRFTFLSWGYSIEPIAPGTTVCAEGLISTYEGVVQIELDAPSKIEIWR